MASTYKAISLSIFKWHLGDCTNGGISSKHNNVLVLHEKGCINVDLDNAPENLMVIKEECIGGKTYKYLEPFKECPSDRTGYMMGGNFAYSHDSRFSWDISLYPLPIHDRSETWEEYEDLSR